jgi:hypothetical protein
MAPIFQTIVTSQDPSLMQCIFTWYVYKSSIFALFMEEK